MKLDEIKKQLLGGRPTSYCEETHISMLVDTMSEGGSIAAFCANAGVDKKTFYNWKKKHVAFNEAYGVAICLAEKHWEKLPITNEKINVVYWCATMRNRFGYDRAKLPQAKSSAINDRLAAYKAACEDGEITIQDYSILTNKLLDEIKIMEFAGAADDNELTPKQKTENSEALIDFFVSKGFKPHEAATMIIHFSEGSKFLSERKQKREQKNV